VRLLRVGRQKGRPARPVLVDVQAEQALVPVLRPLDVTDEDIDVLQVHRALRHRVLAVAIRMVGKGGDCGNLQLLVRSMVDHNSIDRSRLLIYTSPAGPRSSWPGCSSCVDGGPIEFPQSR